MTTRTSTAILVLLFTAAVHTQTPPSPDTMFANAQAKEKAVRTAMTGTLTHEALVKAVRTVAAEYEALVRRYPTSGVADDALWNAGALLLDVFKRLADPLDRTEATRLLRWLASEYPSSTFTPQVTTVLNAASKTAPGPSIRTGETPRPPSGATSTAAANTTAPAAAPPVAPPPVAPPPVAPPLAALPTVTTATLPAVTPSVITSSAPVAPRPTTPAAAPRPPTGLATISDIKRTVLADAIRVTISLDREVPFHLERLTAPDRFFVDLGPTQLTPTLLDRTIRFDGDSNPVRQIRTGRHPNDVSRVVLETADITTCSAYPMYAPYRLVIDCLTAKPIAVPPAASSTRAQPPPAVSSSSAPTASPGGRAPGTTAARTSAPAPPPGPQLLKASRSTSSWTPSLPAGSPSAASLLASVRLGPPLKGKPVAAASIGSLPAAPARNVGGGFSLARQLGLSVSRIVIDPGHGGQDPGGKTGAVTEADLVLDVALRLEKLLVEANNDVVLTRRADTFISLEERTAIANREEADLFLSIHINASSSASATGVETYYLNFANNLGAAAVAARENAASGQSMNALPDVVKTIALNNKLDESRDLATLVQRELVTRLRPSNRNIKDLGVKQAPFVVLIGAAMPSVLTEISFITNQQEAKLLTSTAYRQRIAEALFNAIRKYQGSLKRVASETH